MSLYRLTPPGELVEADSIRDEGRTVALIGTALVMNRPRDVVVRRVPASVVVEVLDEDRGSEQGASRPFTQARAGSRRRPTPSTKDD